MNIFKFLISNNDIYGVVLFDKFIDFRQWYYLYDNGKKLDSWFDVDELKYAIIGNDRDKKGRVRHNLWFEPIPKIITLFRRY